MSSRIVHVALLWLIAFAVSAQTDVQQRFGDYNAHYSVFNSSFIDPDIAATYDITRGGNIALVNIAVTRVNAGGESLGLPGLINGRVQNLLGQSRDLEFKEIREGQATYYLASFPISNEDPQHFFINLRPEGASSTFELKFTRTLYTD
jgi:hypothetical protein